MFRAGDAPIYELSIKMENRPGVIARIADFLAQRKVNIESGVHHASEDPNQGWWCFFVKCEGFDVSRLEDCARRLESLEGVRRVQVSEANVGDLAVDRHHSVQLMGVDRVVAFRTGWIEGIFREIYRRWGDDGRRMIYLEGYYGGRKSYGFWREAFDLEGRELAEAALELWVVLGWAEDVRVVDFDRAKGEATVRVWGSFEAVQPSHRPTCHFLLGAATGFLSEMFEKPLFGQEVKCQATGDEYCEFVIREKPFVFEGVSQPRD